MMAASTHFDTVIRGTAASIEDWQRAMEAPTKELPRLTEEQLAFVKMFGISKDEYARGVLAEQYSEQRLRSRSAKLGSYVQSILDSIAPGTKLLSVVAELSELRWVLRVETGDHRLVTVLVPRALGDDVIDSFASEVVQELEARLRAGLSSPYSSAGE